jgi:hypothetical protein
VTERGTHLCKPGADDNELIVGERGLRACESLGHTDILVRRWPDLSDVERREPELGENLNRKDLTAIERSRQMAARAETTVEVDWEELRTNSVRNGRGHPVEPNSERRVAERLGIPRATIQDAQRHVTAGEHYPELETLSQAEALSLAATLPTFPEQEKPPLRDALIASNAVADDAGKAELDRLRYLRRLGAMLSPLAKRAAEFDPVGVCGHIDGDSLNALLWRPGCRADGGVWDRLASMTDRLTRGALRR